MWSHVVPLLVGFLLRVGPSTHMPTRRMAPKLSLDKDAMVAVLSEALTETLDVDDTVSNPDQFVEEIATRLYDALHAAAVKEAKKKRSGKSGRSNWPKKTKKNHDDASDGKANEP